MPHADAKTLTDFRRHILALTVKEEVWQDARRASDEESLRQRKHVSVTELLEPVLAKYLNSRKYRSTAKKKLSKRR